MKHCVLHYIAFLFILNNSYSLFQNRCNLKPCSKKNNSNHILSPNITCIKSQHCSISERNSSCSLFHEDAHAITLKNIEIHRDNDGLWTQLILRSSHHFDLAHQRSQATFVVRVHFNDNKHCINFVLPAFLIKDSFVLPCIQVSTELQKSLRLLLSVYYIASPKEKAELVFIQATKYSLNSILAKKTMKLKHLKFKYYFDELFFHLAFHTKCTFTYNVSIHESNNKLCSTSGPPICHETNLRNHQSFLDCDQSLFKPCQLYCIRTTFSPYGSCSSVYPKVSSEITYFQRTVEQNSSDFTPTSIFCKHWNAAVDSFNNSKEQTITVKFSPLKAYVDCFHCYEVILYKLFTQNCHSQHKMQIRSAIVDLQTEQGEASFNKLSNGSFCVLILPCMNSIYKAVAQESKVVSIVYEPKKVLKVPQHEIFPLETIIAAIVLLSVTGFGIWLRIKHLLGNKKKKVDIEIDSPEIVPIFQGIKVYVFDAWNDTLRQMLLTLLKHFWQTCAGFEVVDDMVARFLNDPNHWTDEIFDYRCSEMGESGHSNKRFVFIHSGRSMPDINCNKGKAFLSALDGILRYQKKSQMDDCHVFVVYLEKPQCMDGTEKLVQSTRYNIQNNHMIKLCNDLGFPSTQTEKLLEDLENHELYTVISGR